MKLFQYRRNALYSENKNSLLSRGFRPLSGLLSPLSLSSWLIPVLSSSFFESSDYSAPLPRSSRFSFSLFSISFYCDFVGSKGTVLFFLLSFSCSLILQYDKFVVVRSFLALTKAFDNWFALWRARRRITLSFYSAEGLDMFAWIVVRQSPFWII